MTELIWEGKYDKDGKKVAPLRVSLPFQTVETINESAQERQKAFDLFSAGRDSEWRNRLIWGDKKYVLPSLLDEFGGRVNLIYIDPPFNVGANFSFTTTIHAQDDEEESDGTTFTKEPSIIEQKAYRDTWGRGLDSYLQWFYETIEVLRELLTEDGSLYVHLDWHVAHYAKTILDEVFGSDRFLNDIIWQRTASHNDPRRYGIVHDILLFYTRSQRYTWTEPKMAQSDEYIESFFVYAESPTGEVLKLKKGEEPSPGWRRFRLGNFASPHPRPNLTYEYKGYKPPKNGWKVSLEKMIELDKQGRLRFPESKDGRISTKSYLDEVAEGKPVPDLWTGMMTVQSQSPERVDYATQKPEALLERIIKASSNEGDLVLDCFCGSGTTAATAEKINRRWITCDLGRFAIHTTRKRLLSIPNVRPFVVQNLGKYERQVWQESEFRSQESESRNQQSAIKNQQSLHRVYTEFILKLYGARPIAGYSWLHGLKAGRVVHVGAVDAPITTGDVTHIVSEFKRAMGSGKDAPTRNGADVLGWDFAFEINEVARQQAAQANLNLKFIRIPREVLDKQAIAQGDIRFFELAALAVDVKVETPRRGVSTDGRKVTLTLTDFVIPPDDVPEDVQKAVKHWAQWIDYWAVDWDNKGDTFHNEWQAYRTRQERDLTKTVTHTYEEPGEYIIVIKVIDILGNDTTKTVGVEVKR